MQFWSSYNHGDQIIINITIIADRVKITVYEMKTKPAKIQTIEVNLLKSRALELFLPMFGCFEIRWFEASFNI